MYRRDYLLRLIQEMTQMIGKAMGLREQKKRTELLFEWDELMQRRFRINGELSDKLSSDDMARLFMTNGRLHVDELQAFAFLLFERAKLEKEKGLHEEEERHFDSSLEGGVPGQTEAMYIRRSMKALNLLLEAMLHGSDRTMIPVMPSVEQLLHELKPYKLEDSALARLWRWFEQEGRFAEAEDALFHWLQSAAERPEELQLRKKQAYGFYERMEALPDEQLEQGSLPRDEIKQGMEDVSSL